MSVKPRIIAWDLETTGLSANFAYLLCMGWKVIGEKKINLIKITDYPEFEKDCTNDKKLVADCKKVLESADAWITWYGRRFDEPFLNSRLIHHGFSPMPNMCNNHIDGWRTAKYKLRMNSNRLASVSEFLQVEEKTPVKGGMWVKAQAGHKNALSYVYKHCRQDIVVLEQVYEKIKPLIDPHPNLNVITGTQDACPRCGTVGRLQKRGYHTATSRRYQRWACTNCGAWSRSILCDKSPKKVKIR